MAEAIIQIIDLIKGDYGKAERRKLREVSSHMREGLQNAGFDILGSNSQIIPVLVGAEEKGIQAKAYLEENGFTSSLFICPAVPKGQSIIRFSLCSDITIEEVDEVVRLLLKARQMLKF